jgi:predicted Zn-dependent peptidase
VLASGKTSRLYKRLVYDMQIAQDVSAWQQSGQLSSQFEITVTLRKGKKVDEVIAAIDDELAKLRAKGPTEDEIARARAKMISTLVFGMERVTGRANALNEYNQNAGDPGYFERELARCQALAPGDVQAAIVRHLPADRRVLTTVTPVKDAPRAGRLVKASEVPPKDGGAKPAADKGAAERVKPASAAPAKPEKPAKPAAAPAKAEPKKGATP